MIPVDEIAMRPTISFLSREDRDKIHKAAFQILNEVGMRILQDEALDLLKDAGCSVAEDRMVKIPGELVQRCIESAPAHIPVHDREGSQVMDLGGHNSYFGTGSDLIYALDSKTGQRHACVLEDVDRNVVHLVIDDLDLDDRPQLLACGPDPMLRACADLALRNDLSLQVSVEEHMGCGVGTCQGCVVLSSEGEWIKSCTEGPVFDARELTWRT